jgi:hypothetical protein
MWVPVRSSLRSWPNRGNGAENPHTELQGVTAEVRTPDPPSAGVSYMNAAVWRVGAEKDENRSMLGKRGRPVYPSDPVRSA